MCIRDRNHGVALSSPISLATMQAKLMTEKQVSTHRLVRAYRYFSVLSGGWGSRPHWLRAAGSRRLRRRETGG